VKTQKLLKLGPDTELPLDAVTQKLAWLGRTGSGKTYGASKLAEEMLEADAQVVVLDPVGVWWGLRLAADGQGGGISIPVFGGLHGDVPLEPTGGAFMANLIVDRGISVVLDVSQFESDAAKARFAHEWADRFFFRKKAAPSAVHVFLEECQEFVPQEPMKGEERMLHAFQRIEKLGRNFGIGVSLISQRPQEVNKKALNQSECVFAFQMTGPQERAAIKKWVAEKGLDEDVADALPRMEVGQAHVWSPQWLRVSAAIRIGRKRTFNASSTPEVGIRATTRHLAPIDLEQIRTDMAATIERAKAEDPRELRNEISRLRHELRHELRRAEKERAASPAAAPAKTRDVPVLKDAQVKRLEMAIQRLRDGEAAFAKALHHHTDRLAQRQQVVVSEVGTLAELLKAATAAARGGGGHEPAKVAAPREPGLRTDIKPGPHRPAPRPAAKAADGIAPVEQRILDGLAELQALGIESAERAQLALLVGYTHPQSTGFVKALGSVRAAGLVDYVAGGRVALTDAGVDKARAEEAPVTSEELQGRLLRMLDPVHERLLRPLIGAYPGSLDRSELAGASGYTHVQSTGFVKALGRLRSLGLVDYPGSGSVVARPVLFLEGA
jgi:hypothetical protein